LRIERNVDAARFEHAQYRRDQNRAAVRQHDDAISGRAAEFAQAPGNTGTEAIQSAVVEGDICIRQGALAGMGAGVRRDGFNDSAAHAADLRGSATTCLRRDSMRRLSAP
jgi:hypothetical protein